MQPINNIRTQEEEDRLLRHFDSPTKSETSRYDLGNESHMHVVQLYLA